MKTLSSSGSFAHWLTIKVAGAAILGLFLSLGAVVPARASSPCLTIVSSQVFSGSSCQGDIVIPEGVTTIRGNAFLDVTAITSVSLPVSLTSIGIGAFRGTTQLRSITFAPGSQVTTIGREAFAFSGLTSITIPASVTSIGDLAFFQNYSLASVTFESNSRLSTIGSSTFFSARSLESIRIPSSVTAIGSFAFYDSSSLTSVLFEPESQLTTIRGSAFTGTAVQEITLPASLTLIDGFAFFFASSLSEVKFLGNAPTVGSAAFDAVGPTPKALIKRGASGFPQLGSTWKGLTVDLLTSELSLVSEGSVTTQAVEVDGSPTDPQLVREGFTLKGWASSQDAQVSFAANLSDFTIGIEPRTLYAVWEKIVAPVTEPSVSDPVIVQFSGPLLLRVERDLARHNSSPSLSFVGRRLHQIVSVRVDGVELTILSKSPGRLMLLIPKMQAGSYNLEFETKSGKLTFRTHLG